MKKLYTHSKNSLFLIEMIMVLLFLSLSSVACIRIFAAASLNHTKAVDWRHIQSLTTSVGEILEGTDGTPDSVSEFLSGSTQNSSTLIWYYDKNWEICSSEKASHKMTLILSTDAMIKEGTLTFYSVHEKKETEFYQTELAFPTISSDRKEASS